MPAETAPFLATNILIYALTEPGPKSDRTLAAIEAGGVISVQVLNETAHVLSREQRLHWMTIGDIPNIARKLLTVVPLTEAAHLPALGIAQATGYSVWDANVIATAAEAGCDMLLSEDRQDGHRVEGLRISNPFAG